MAAKTLNLCKMSTANIINSFCHKFKPIFSISHKFFTRYGTNIDPLPTRYGGKTNVTILPGSGIGPEIMESTLKVLDAAEAPLSYEILNLPTEVDSMDEIINASTSIKRNRVALKGNIETKSKDPLVTSRNVFLRKTLDLYVYVLFCKTYPGLENKFGDIDITVVRQNTEGEYLMLEHQPTKGRVESLKVVTRYNSERIAEFAFNYALTHSRKLITVVHNADVLFYTEGVFVEAAKTVAKKYPSVEMNIKEVGVAVAQMAQDPRIFDIILATNLNGSMVSNFLSGMLGGPGLTSGTNYSDSGIAVFEPGARNKGSSIVGQGIANPVAMILSGINLLDYLGYKKTAEVIRTSVFATLVFDKVRTLDLGGTATTEEITNNVIQHIKKHLKLKTPKRPLDDENSGWRSHCSSTENSEQVN